MAPIHMGEGRSVEEFHAKGEGLGAIIHDSGHAMLPKLSGNKYHDQEQPKVPPQPMVMLAGGS